MKIELIGMSELIDKLEKYHEAPKRAANKALRSASEVMLESEKKTLLSMHKKDRATGKGAKNLKIGKIKTYSSGNKYIGIGFTKDMLGNWNDIKGAYMQHYGYYEHKSGKYMAGSNWLGVAFEDASKKSYEIIKDTLISELNKIG